MVRVEAYLPARQSLLRAVDSAEFPSGSSFVPALLASPGNAAAGQPPGQGASAASRIVKNKGLSFKHAGMMLEAMVFSHSVFLSSFPLSTVGQWRWILQR